MTEVLCEDGINAIGYDMGGGGGDDTTPLFADDFERAETTPPDLGSGWDPVGDYWFIGDSGEARQDGQVSSNASFSLTNVGQAAVRVVSTFGERSDANSAQAIVVQSSAAGQNMIRTGRYHLNADDETGTPEHWESRVQIVENGIVVRTEVGPDVAGVGTEAEASTWEVTVTAGRLLVTVGGVTYFDLDDIGFSPARTYVGMWGYGAFFDDFTVYPADTE